MREIKYKITFALFLVIWSVFSKAIWFTFFCIPLLVVFYVLFIKLTSVKK